MINLTTNQFAVLAARTAGLYATAEIAKGANVSWHSANVALKALKAKGLLDEAGDVVLGLTLDSATFTLEGVSADRIKKLPRRQFATLLAVMAGKTRTCEVAVFGGMPWHSANVALAALCEKGFIWCRDGAEVAPRAFNGLRSVSLEFAA